MSGLKSNPLKFPFIYALVMLGFYISPIGGLRRLARSSDILRLLLDDSILHFLSFALLAWLLCLGYKRSFRHPFPIFKIVSLSFLYGLLIELIQKFLPYRSFSLWDLLADGLGIAAGCLLFRLFFFPRFSTTKSSP
jgi:VanZ family protein